MKSLRAFVPLCELNPSGFALITLIAWIGLIGSLRVPTAECWRSRHCGIRGEPLTPKNAKITLITLIAWIQPSFRRAYWGRCWWWSRKRASRAYRGRCWRLSRKGASSPVSGLIKSRAPHLTPVLPRTDSRPLCLSLRPSRLCVSAFKSVPKNAKITLIALISWIQTPLRSPLSGFRSRQTPLLHAAPQAGVVSTKPVDDDRWTDIDIFDPIFSSH